MTSATNSEESETMQKSLPATRPQSPGSDSDETDQVHNQSLVIPNRVVTIADALRKNDHSWFVTSQIPTDLSIQVEDTTFNVHKYPLVSKCGYISHRELQTSSLNFGHDLKLENFPGGSETFEIVLKFCYGLPVDLNPDNIARLRCAAEFLEMTEELEEGNLISKAEAFLTFVVLSSWRDNIIVLKSCESLYPWAENLQIVRRCCDSIAYKASRDSSTSGDTLNESWWVNDVATLRMDHFMRIMTAVKAKGAKPEIIGKCIMQYTDIWLPDMDVELEGLKGYGYRKNEVEFSISSGKKDERIGYKEQRTIIEGLISLLPTKEEAVSCKFLLRILKMAIVYSVSPVLVSELEKRAGVMLEDATVSDLLIPRYKHGDQGKLLNSPDQHTMYDIDVVQRIVEYFLMHEQQQQQQQIQGSVKANISKLLDNYLAEIAREPNLSITRFQVLAESLPDKTRTCHDGLYRAIDTYLKAHPSLSEHDRKRVCKIMNCEKLSLDACMHVAQNERLPLRTVIQVLFSEQIKMREAMRKKEPATESDNILEQEASQTSTTNEIKTLKTELEQVKTQMMELQHDYSELQHDYEKINSKQRSISGWSFGWKKIKNAALSSGEEIIGGKQRSKSVGRKVNFSKRLSMS